MNETKINGTSAPRSDMRRVAALLLLAEQMDGEIAPSLAELGIPAPPFRAFAANELALPTAVQVTPPEM